MYDKKTNTIHLQETLGQIDGFVLVGQRGHDRKNRHPNIGEF